MAVYRSNNLADIPPSERWDLVISNPPHFDDRSPGQIRYHDPEWSIHRGFFAAIGRHLNPGGVIVLQENNEGSTPATFTQMIGDAGLAVVFVQDAFTERTPRCHVLLLGIIRADDTPPAWARA